LNGLRFTEFFSKTSLYNYVVLHTLMAAR